MFRKEGQYKYYESKYKEEIYDIDDNYDEFDRNDYINDQD
jgi:hypothetical protein